jgi:hypothetical protein
MGTDDALGRSMATGKMNSTPRKRAVRTPTARKSRAAPVKAPEVADRSSVYRGISPEEARAAYYADARVMSRMGYAPDAEEWSTVLEHVLTVRYVFAPSRLPAVLAALDEVESEPANAGPEPAEAPPSLLRRTIGLGERLPLALKLPVGGVAGLLVGLVVCLLVGFVSGDRPDTITLLGFGVIGMVLGSALGLIPD